MLEVRCLFDRYGGPRHLHVLTHSCPTGRSSDLRFGQAAHGGRRRSALCVRVRLGRRRACDSDTRIVHCRRSPARRLPSRPNLLLSANRQEPARSLVAASRATTRYCGNRGGADNRLSAVSLLKEPAHVAPCPPSHIATT